MLHGDLMLLHEVSNLQVCFDFPYFCSLSPGEVFFLRKGSSSSSFSGVSPMLGQVASLLVADEAFAVLHVLCSFTGREVDFIHIHGVGVGVSGSASW